MDPLSPETRSARRLGYIILLGYGLCAAFMLLTTVFGLGFWGCFGAAFLMSLSLPLVQPPLYRWVTAPEREASPEAER